MAGVPVGDEPVSPPTVRWEDIATILDAVSPAQRRHVGELRKLDKRDPLPVMRITEAMSRLGQ